MIAATLRGSRSKKYSLFPSYLERTIIKKQNMFLMNFGKVFCSYNSKVNQLKIFIKPAVIGSIKRHESRLCLTFYIYTLLGCLGVWLFVCPFVSNSNTRQNGWTDQAQIFCGTSHNPRKVYGCSKLHKFVSKSFWFLSDFEKSRKNITISAYFFFTSLCLKQKMDAKSPKGLIYKTKQDIHIYVPSDRPNG